MLPFHIRHFRFAESKFPFPPAADPELPLLFWSLLPLPISLKLIAGKIIWTVRPEGFSVPERNEFC